MNDWSLAWRLARRDLKARFRGLRLLLVCLFLGVGALAAIGSLTRAIGDELADRGSLILGGDVQFGVAQRRADADERAYMATLGRVSETVRLQSMAVRDDASAPIQLKGVDAAYPLVGRVMLQGGRQVGAPDARTTWIAPALADRLSLRVGDRIRFGSADFTVGGIIADEPDRLGEGFTLGPVAIVSMEGIARSGLIQPGSLYQSRYRVLLAGRSPDAARDAFEARFPEAGWETRTRDRAAPGASRFIERMGEFLVLVGLAALAIAGIGVGNGVASYLGARRRSIAMLKVMGATSGIIARTYLLQILAVASIGIIGGLLVGIATVPLIVALAGDVLPVAPRFAIHWQPLALATAYGLLVALAFSAPPLLAAGSVPAAGLLRPTDDRAAPVRTIAIAMGIPLLLVVALALATSQRPLLSGGFLLGVAATLALLAVIGQGIRRGAAALPRPRAPLPRLAIASLHRPGARTTALVVALGLGLTLFVVLAGIRTSLDGNIAQSVPDRAPALFALDVPRDKAADFTATVRNVAPDASVATVPLLRGAITAYGRTRVSELETLPPGGWVLRGDRALTYAAMPPAGSEVVAGKWWPAGYRGPPLVSVDAEQAAAIGLKIGDPLTVSVLGFERTATVASFRRVKWDNLQFNFSLVFSPGSFDDVPHNLSASVDMGPGREAPVMRALLARFPSVSVIEVRGVLDQVRTVVGQMAAAIAAAATIAILAGIAVLIGAIAAAREARTFDAVMLKVLGATRAQVLGAQAIEVVLLALILSGLALVLGLAIAWAVVTQLFGFDWLPDYGAVIATLATGAAITVVIGLAGALPILAARPAAALRQL